MKLIEPSYETNSPVTRKLDIANSTVIFNLLSSKLYADPFTAVLRELSSNAIDSGGDYTVTMPTIEHPYLIISDNGVGMTRSTLLSLYLTVGASDKRADNTKIGGYGIGRLSALSLSDSFTVSSSRDGYRTTLAIVNNNAIEIGYEPTNETGTTVKIPRSYSKWNKIEAESFFYYYAKPPVGYEVITIDKSVRTPNYVVSFSKYVHACVVRVGGIPYIYGTHPKVIIDIPIGGISLSSSREEIVGKINMSEVTDVISQYLQETAPKSGMFELAKFLREAKSTYDSEFHLSPIPDPIFTYDVINGEIKNISAVGDWHIPFRIESSIIYWATKRTVKTTKYYFDKFVVFSKDKPDFEVTPVQTPEPIKRSPKSKVPTIAVPKDYQYHSSSILTLVKMVIPQAELGRKTTIDLNLVKDKLSELNWIDTPTLVDVNKYPNIYKDIHIANGRPVERYTRALEFLGIPIKLTGSPLVRNTLLNFRSTSALEQLEKLLELQNNS